MTFFSIDLIKLVTLGNIKDYVIWWLKYLHLSFLLNQAEGNALFFQKMNGLADSFNQVKYITTFVIIYAYILLIIKTYQILKAEKWSAIQYIIYLLGIGGGSYLFIQIALSSSLIGGRRLVIHYSLFMLFIIMESLFCINELLNKEKPVKRFTILSNLLFTVMVMFSVAVSGIVNLESIFDIERNVRLEENNIIEYINNNFTERDIVVGWDWRFPYGIVEICDLRYVSLYDVNLESDANYYIINDGFWIEEMMEQFEYETVYEGKDRTESIQKIKSLRNKEIAYPPTIE